MKPKIDEIKYAQPVNEKMKHHRKWREGIRVDQDPESEERPLGLKLIGGPGVEKMVTSARSQVEEEFELVVSK